MDLPNGLFFNVQINNQLTMDSHKHRIELEDGTARIKKDGSVVLGPAMEHPIRAYGPVPKVDYTGLTYTLAKHTPPEGEPYWTVVIDNIALPPGNFPHLPRQLKDTLTALQAKHLPNGNLRHASVYGTWLLADPNILRFMQKRSIKAGYSLEPEKPVSERDIDYARLVKKSLGSFTRRAESSFGKGTERYRQAVLFKSRLIEALKRGRSRGVIEITREISNLTQIMGPQGARDLMPALFRNYFLRPK
jgi:hypothetical protein